MPRSTRSSGGSSTTSSPSRTSSSSAPSRVTRSASARAGVPTAPPLTPVAEERRHSDSMISPRPGSLEFVPILPTPVMTSADPSPSASSAAGQPPTTPSTAESAIRRDCLHGPAAPNSSDMSSSPVRRLPPLGLLTSPLAQNPPMDFSPPHVFPRLVIDTSPPRADSPTFGRSSIASSTLADDLSLTCSGATATVPLPPAALAPPSTAPSMAGATLLPDVPSVLHDCSGVGLRAPPCQSGSGSGTTSSTLTTVNTDHTRALIPPSAFQRPDSPPVGLPRPHDVGPVKLIFLHPPMSATHEFVTALRRYQEDAHLSGILPLRDKSGFQVTCDSSRTASRILRAPIPPVLRGCFIRPPRPRNQTPTITQEILINDVPLSISLDDLQMYIQSTYQVHISYRNRVHAQDAHGALDFKSPTPRVRIRVSPADASVLTRAPRIQVQANLQCTYDLTRSVHSVRQCYRCYRFGHTISACTHMPRCKKCGLTDHIAADCALDAPVCLHCGGGHVPTYRGCPDFREQNLRHQTFTRPVRAPPALTSRSGLRWPSSPAVRTREDPSALQSRLAPSRPVPLMSLPTPATVSSPQPFCPAPDPGPLHSGPPPSVSLTRPPPSHPSRASGPLPLDVPPVPFVADTSVPPPSLPHGAPQSVFSHSTRRHPAPHVPVSLPPAPLPPSFWSPSLTCSLPREVPPGPSRDPRSPLLSVHSSPRGRPLPQCPPLDAPPPDRRLFAPLHHIQEAWHALSSLIQRNGASSLYCTLAQYLLHALRHHA